MQGMSQAAVPVAERGCLLTCCMRHAGKRCFTFLDRFKEVLMATVVAV